MPDFLTVEDMNNQIGAARVLQYLCDDGSGSIDISDPQVANILNRAEGAAYHPMLRTWTKAQIIELAASDEAFLANVAMVACEFASRRRPEFTNEAGEGAHIADYRAATKSFDALAKANLRSKGEETAGKSSAVGGRMQPKPPIGTEQQFDFAPSRNNPKGSGGF